MRVGEMIAGPQRIEATILEATPSADQICPRFVRQNQCPESGLRSIGHIVSGFGREAVGSHRGDVVVMAGCTDLWTGSAALSRTGS